MALTSDAITTEGLANLNSLQHGILVTLTSASTLTLTAESPTSYVFTGTAAGQILRLPDATTLGIGRYFRVDNNSTQYVTIQNSGGSTVDSIIPGGKMDIILQANNTAAGTWLMGPNSFVYNIYLSETSTFQTVSTTDVVITGFQLTPAPGTYTATVNIQASGSSNNANLGVSIYRGNSIVTESLMVATCGSGARNIVLTTQAQLLSLDGNTIVDVRVKTDSGTLTVKNRSIILMRTGP